MKLSSLLNSQLIFLGKDFETKKQMTHFLIDEMSQRFPSAVSLEDLRTSVDNRESLGGTTFPTGISIPHARFENFDDIVISILIPKTPFTDNGVLVKMVVLILTAANKPALYLNCLSGFAKLSQNEKLFTKLIEARSTKDFLDMMEELPFTVKAPILVENVMTTKTISVGLDTSLREINDLFFKNQFSYLPVLNDKNELMGEIRLLDVLELGIPDYARNMGTLRFTKSLETFETLIEKEKTLLAKQIMKAPLSPVTPDTSLLEASMEMLKTKSRQLGVIQNNKFIGIISYMDILNKIIRN